MSRETSILSRVTFPFFSQYGSSSAQSGGMSEISRHVDEFTLVVLLVIQCSLLHPAFAHSRLARLLRNGLTPINFIWCFLSPLRAPPKQSNPRSFGELFSSFFHIYMGMKSLEWGFAAESYYTRRLTMVDGVKGWQKPRENDDSYKKAQEEEPIDMTKMAAWIFLQFTSLRGLQFTWGPPAAANTHSTFSLLLRLFCVNIPMTCALGFIALSRDSPIGTPVSLLTSVGVPNFPGLTLLSEALYSACFGIWIACALDARYTTATLGMTIIHRLATMIGRCPQHILDLFDPINFPPMINSPHKASSIAHFWGKAWHTALQRSFLIAGGKPMVWITKKIGASSRTQRLAGLFGVFAASALIHEYPPYAWSQGQNSTFLKSQSLPGAFFFFMMQPFAILIEPYLIPLIPKNLGGGALWVWVFLLSTAYPFRKQYLEEREMSAMFRPISQWSWMYALNPLKD